MLEREFGLAAPIGVNAIEVAVDIRPKSGAIRDRLAMVVLLQRHFGVHRPEWSDRQDDARYVFRQRSGGKPKLSYVIQRFKNRPESGTHSDQEIDDALVRERILRVKSHRAPFLDSTLYFGREGGPAMVSIEHKTSDRRDPGKGTAVPLSEEDCRARIEVRLQREALEKLKLQRLDDVFGFRFQDLRKPVFSFWLPTIRTFGKGMEQLDETTMADRIEIFTNSGAYGLDRFEQAEFEAWRETMKDINRKARREGEEIDRRVPAKRRATVRDKRKSFDDLNEKVRVALRTLARRMDADREAKDRDDEQPLVQQMAA